MSANPWHKRYHSDALHGFMSLTLEERGAFQTILDLIYDRGSALIDNDRLLAGYMGVSLRKWNSLRQILIEKRKIYIDENGMIANFRAEKEIENALKTSRKRAENGAKGGRNSCEKSKNDNENNENDKQLLSKSEAIRARSRSQKLDIPSSKEEGEIRPNSDTAFWDNAVAYIGDRGKVGKLLKGRSQSEVAAAITEAQLARAVDPFPYVQRVLSKSEALEDCRVGI